MFKTHDQTCAGTTSYPLKTQNATNKRKGGLDTCVPSNAGTPEAKMMDPRSVLCGREHITQVSSSRHSVSFRSPLLMTQQPYRQTSFPARIAARPCASEGGRKRGQTEGDESCLSSDACNWCPHLVRMFAFNCLKCLQSMSLLVTLECKPHCKHGDVMLYAAVNFCDILNCPSCQLLLAHTAATLCLTGGTRLGKTDNA